MAPEEPEPAEVGSQCGCFSQPHRFLADDRELGMDDHYAEISLLACSVCGQVWLRYLFELEAFTASGRWFLGAIDDAQLSQVSAQNARETLESLDWYYYGGSYFGGKSGRAFGRIDLNP